MSKSYFFSVENTIIQRMDKDTGSKHLYTFSPQQVLLIILKHPIKDNVSTQPFGSAI